MATLTNADYVQIQNLVRQDPTARSVFKAMTLDKSTWKQLFQTCETWNVNAFNTLPTTSYKAAVDAITPLTVQQAKTVWVIWSRWKAPQVI